MMQQEASISNIGRCLSDCDFSRFAVLITTESGIKLPPVKKTMLSSRLAKRLKALKLTSFEDYYDYLCSEEGRKLEFHQMLDSVSTNKTDFFRESNHFDHLVKRFLPSFIEAGQWTPERPLRVWSAGCSTGEEPYTLAMVLEDFAARHGDLDFSILATDLSTQVLERAASGIYDRQRIVPVPTAMKSRYVLKSKDPKKRLVRIIPELRRKIRFRRLNFMNADYDLPHPMDLVFCRNVIIYFSLETQQLVLSRICGGIRKGGYLFMGHSEMLQGLDLPIQQVISTVYRKETI